MKGLFALLTEKQRSVALTYRGLEVSGVSSPALGKDEDLLKEVSETLWDALAHTQPDRSDFDAAARDVIEIIRREIMR